MDLMHLLPNRGSQIMMLENQGGGEYFMYFSTFYVPIQWIILI